MFQRLAVLATAVILVLAGVLLYLELEDNGREELPVN